MGDVYLWNVGSLGQWPFLVYQTNNSGYKILAHWLTSSLVKSALYVVFLCLIRAGIVSSASDFLKVERPQPRYCYGARCRGSLAAFDSRNSNGVSGKVWHSYNQGNGCWEWLSRDWLRSR